MWTEMASVCAWSIHAHVSSAGWRRRTGDRRVGAWSASPVNPEAGAGNNAEDASGRTSHAGYHRIEGFPRPFFEGWYFRVTLPTTRDNLSLIYHVYDPVLDLWNQFLSKV